MNGKKIACIVLLIFVAIAAYCGQIMHQKSEAKRAEAESAIEATASARGKLDTVKIQTERLRTESDELVRFLHSWEPHADRMQTQSEVEESVLASLRSSNLLIISQKFESRNMPASTGAKGSAIPKIVRASLVLEDDYAKTMNWIGELERRLPMARMMSCRITGGDNGRQVHAEVAIEVPMVNLKFEIASVEPGKGKKK